jgi:protein TonB
MLALLITVICATFGYGQNGLLDPEYDETVAAPSDSFNTKASDYIYRISDLDESPEFPGGTAAFYQYLAKAFPSEAGTRTRVVIGFIVDQDGTLSDIKVLRNRSTTADDELLRTLKKSPKWKPGRKNGAAVRCQYTIPIIFS